jgi:hypothetical protein
LFQNIKCVANNSNVLYPLINNNKYLQNFNFEEFNIILNNKLNDLRTNGIDKLNIISYETGEKTEIELSNNNKIKALIFKEAKELIKKNNISYINKKYLSVLINEKTSFIGIAKTEDKRLIYKKIDDILINENNSIFPR